MKKIQINQRLLMVFLLAFTLMGNTISVQAQVINEGFEESLWVTSAGTLANQTVDISTGTINTGSWIYNCGSVNTVAASVIADTKTFFLAGGGAAFICTPLIPGGVATVSVKIRSGTTTAAGLCIGFATNTAVTSNTGSISSTGAAAAWSINSSTWANTMPLSNAAYTTITFSVTNSLSTNPGYIKIQRYSAGSLEIDDIVITSPVIGTPATVTTQAVSAITATTATGNGTITDTGSSPITVSGVCWNTSANPTIANNLTTDGPTTATSFTSSITGLTPNTLYYVRAYATNGSGTSYGNEVTFTTSAAAPTVTTQAVSGITGTAATGNGTIVSNNGSAILESGVCWSTTSGAESISGSHTTDGGTAVAPFTSSMSGLTSSTTYYVKAYATNALGTSYGTEVSFATSALSAACDITAFSMPGQLIPSTIVGTAISVLMPGGTNVTSLTPSITPSAGASVSPTGAQDFTSPLIYTVTAENGTTTQQYTVTVTVNEPIITLCSDINAPFAVSGWTASASDIIEVSASSLEGDVGVLVDIPFQVSLDNTAWSSSVVVVKSGTTAGATVYVRYNPSFGDSHTGNIIFSTQGGLSQVIPLEGTASSVPQEFFRSIANGAWNNLATWEISTDKVSWIAAATLPTIQSTQILINDSVNIPVAYEANAYNLRIKPTAKLINNGTLNLVDSLVFESNNTNTAQLLNNSIVNNAAVIKLEKTMLTATGFYFMSFPFEVTAANITNAVTGAVLTASGPIGALADYRLARYDGFTRDAAGAPNGTSGVYWATETFPLEKGIGYIIKTAVNRTIAFTSAPGETELFANTASIPVEKYVTAVSASNRSWNLRGNPFSVGFDLIDATQTHAPFYIFNGSTYQTIMSGQNYKVYPFTGFFLQAFGVSNSLTFDNTGRMFKSATAVQETNFDEVELFIEQNGVQMDQVRIRINDGATTDYDPQIDGAKILSSVTSVPQLYSRLNNINYSVNSLPKTSGGPTVVPLSIYIPEIGAYSIRLVNPEKISRFKQVVLIDSIVGTTTDLLQQQAYDFSSPVTGTTHLRMALILDEAQIPTGLVKINGTNISLKQAGAYISFTGLDSEADVKLFDASGRLIQQFTSVTNNQSLLVNTDGVYVVSVTTKANSLKTKVIVKR